MSDSTTQKLFRALVVGGAMLSLTACSTPASQNTESKAPPAKSEQLDCDKICSGGEDRERFCPDETNGGVENCCWLMVQRHPCCGEK
jgi:hypothetical protein